LVPQTTGTGKVAEWSNALDSKSSVRLWRTVGSNPTLSARTLDPAQGDNEKAPEMELFLFLLQAR
jgi:hypothetical protein